MFKPSSALPPIVFDASPREYHAIDAKIPRGDPAKTLSQSELKAFAQCPHRWLAGYREEESPAMSDGSLADVVTLTPTLFDALYTVTPESYPGTVKGVKGVGEPKLWNWNADYCQEWKEVEEVAGKTVVKPQHAADAWKAREIFFRNEHIAAFHAVSKTQVQVNVEWYDEETGLVIPFKCLLDVVPAPDSEFGDTIADFKRTHCAEYRKWTRSVLSLGMHAQAAVYLDAINAATGSAYRNYENHIQESFAPWETTHRMLSAEFIMLGRTAYQRDLAEYCRALKTGNWRGYDCAIVDLEPWMIA